MKIAIIGTGSVGSAMARGWSAAGHEVLLGVRDTQQFKGRDLVERQGITLHDIPDALFRAEVIVLAIPPDAIPAVAGFLDEAADKVIIDPSNSFRSKPEGFENGYEALRQLTKCVHIMKAFNTTGAENLEDPLYPGGAIDTFVAGDSARGKEVVATLAHDLGFSACHDFGGSDQVALLESLGLAWINLALAQGMGRQIAIRVVQR